MSDLITLRKKKSSKFYAVDLRIIENSELSWAAKGVWTYLISRPDGWAVNRSDLLGKSKDGDTALRKILKDLEDAGLLKIERQKVQGKFGPTIWTVFEEPFEVLPYVENPHVENPHVENPQAEDPHVEKPHVENPHDLQSTSITNYPLTNYQSTNNQQTKSASADLQEFDDADFCDASQKPIRVPRNQRDFEEPLHPESEPKELTTIQQMAAELITLGVDQIMAESLVINHKQVVRNQLDWLPHRNAKNPAGYIVQAIKGNYEPPKHIAEELKAKAESEAHAARIQAQKEAWEKHEKERLEDEKKRQSEQLAWWESLSDEQKAEHKRKQQEAVELEKQKQMQAMSEAKKKILAAKVNAEKWQLNRFNQNNQAVGG